MQWVHLLKLQTEQIQICAIAWKNLIQLVKCWTVVFQFLNKWYEEFLNQVPHPYGSAEHEHLSLTTIPQCEHVSPAVSCLFSIYRKYGNQTHKQCWKWSHGTHVNTHVLLWIFACNGSVNPCNPHRCSKARHYSTIFPPPHTQCWCNNIRVGGDFKGWLTFGWVSACLWVQLDLLTFFTPIKPACGIHDSIVASCSYLLYVVSLNSAAIQGWLRSQMLYLVVCLWTWHLLAVWVMVCGAVAWCAVGEHQVFSGLYTAHLFPVAQYVHIAVRESWPHSLWLIRDDAAVNTWNW